MLNRKGICAPIVLLVGTIALAGAASAEVIRSAAGGDAAAIQAMVDQYRADLGVLNPNNPGTFGSGRREINWDGVPDNFSSPNLMPGDFFNAPTAPRARGVVLSSPGIGVTNSADNDNPAGAAIRFGDIEPTYAKEFAVFSSQRLFSPMGSNITDVNFFIAGSDVAATTRGFGAIFTDVDLAGSSWIELYAAGGEQIGKYAVPAAGLGSESFSFLGISFEDAIVARVRIVSGSAALAAGVLDVSRDGAHDLVVMDDFIYGEPVPEPASLLLLAAGGLAAIRRR